VFKPGRKALSPDIPREVVRYELPEAEQVCACGHALHEAFKNSFLAVQRQTIHKFCHDDIRQ
jgi:hypothetical protein